MKPVRFFISSYKYVLALILSIVLLVSTAGVSGQPESYCSGICGLAWSPVNENLLGAVNEFGLWLVDMGESENDHHFFAHENVTSLSFDSTGQTIAITSCPALNTRNSPCKGSLSLFNVQEQSWRELVNYDYPINNVKFSPDGKYIAFQKDEISEWGIQVIDLATNETFTLGSQKLTNLIIEYAFDCQSKMIVISNGDIGYEGHVFWGLSVWRLSDQTLQAQTKNNLLAAGLAFTEAENNIMFVKYDTEIFDWNYQTGVISSRNKPNETIGDNLHQLSFSDPPTYLLAALVDRWEFSKRMLFIWDIRSSKQIFFLDAPENSFMDLITINSTGTYIAYSSTVTDGKIIEVWKKAAGNTSQFILHP